TEHSDISSSCGKVDAVLSWYQAEYQFAQDNILIDHRDGDCFIVIDNQLLNQKRDDGLFLNLDELIEASDSQFISEESHSTSKYFRASAKIKSLYQDSVSKAPIGKNLLPEFFYYKKDIAVDVEGHSRLEHNIFDVMPWIVSSEAPLLDAAKVNTQVEFDRTFRTIVKEKGYQGKNIVYISGLNIDISPQENQLFPLTKFIPWAAFIKNENGSQKIIEQDELYSILQGQSEENSDQIDMEEAIEVMEKVKEIKIF
ncbi:MAG: hypothetical protein OQK76_10690, partial [Gammaproteobacteria bacterium]|nr:hypothetical protein [Gammaproteobacteria bacterium]